MLGQGRVRYHAPVAWPQPVEDELLHSLDPLERLAVAVVARAIADVEDPRAPGVDRITAREFLAGSGSWPTWAGVVGSDPGRLSGRIARLLPR